MERIIGYFNNNPKLKDELKNQNVFATNKPNVYHCPTASVSFDKNTLDKMNELGLFVYQDINLKTVSEKEIKKSQKKKDKKVNWQYVRIGVMIFLIVLFGLGNVILFYLR